ncbi:hypothetical protein C8Q80DRAFT_1104039, partial [Daedaleopsis nitida]
MLVFQSFHGPARALDRINELGLHIPELYARDVSSKWAVQHSKKTSLQKGSFWRYTFLYQCACGCDHTAGSTPSINRQIAYLDVGCNAFIKLVTTFDSSSPGRNLLAIHNISGLLTHSSACLEQKTASRDARLPLHPEIRLYAQSLLQKGVSGPAVYTQANTWSKATYPPIQHAFNPDPHYRYTYLPHDTTSLYRSLRLKKGISQRSTAHENIHTWFRQDNPSPPSPELTSACLFYQPYILDETDRFILILSTSEQRTAAWNHGHHRTILADLTFGFCSARTNLWILMVVDDQFRGIPVAYVIFSAKANTSERGVHGDYNKALVELILGKWVDAMGLNAAGEKFCPFLGVTDNDVRERHAMSTIWPNILLLLCLFHTWQAWKNGLNRSLAGIPISEARTSVRKRLAAFCMQLYATAAFRAEQDYFKTLQHPGRTTLEKKLGSGGLKFLQYLSSYLASRDLWLQWSRAGVIQAAETLGIPEKSVPRTTNHLESHNGHIKNDYFAQHQHGGQLPRADVWIIALVTEVIPDFF